VDDICLKNSRKHIGHLRVKVGFVHKLDHVLFKCDMVLEFDFLSDEVYFQLFGKNSFLVYCYTMFCNMIWFTNAIGVVHNIYSNCSQCNVM